MLLLFLLFLMIGPRFTTVMWWIFQPARISMAFSSTLFAVLGVLFAPWTTLMYLIVYPGGITGFDWLWLGFAIMADLATYGGSGYRIRR